MTLLQATEPAKQLSGLTNRECEVTALLQRGLSNRQIATALRLREGTIKQHVHNIYQKLGFRSRFALVCALSVGGEDAGASQPSDQRPAARA
jgi:two-component system, NarL family, nitrate/nitrite response regulator NarL